MVVILHYVFHPLIFQANQSSNDFESFWTLVTNFVPFSLSVGMHLSTYCLKKMEPSSNQRQSLYLSQWCGLEVDRTIGEEVYLYGEELTTKTFGQMPLNILPSSWPVTFSLFSFHEQATKWRTIYCLMSI